MDREPVLGTDADVPAYLPDHQAVAEAYTELKRELASQHRDDIRAYTAQNPSS